MLANRLIACFDVIGGKVTKASQFQNNIDIEDAVTAAKRIYEMQIDELIFYDVTASAEKRPIDLNLVEAVGKEVFVPYTVGGGIRNLTDMYNVLKSGAEKISVDSMAVRNPEIIAQGAKEFGSQCIVLSMQVKRVPKSGKIPSGYEIAIDGARVFTGMDALEWIRQGVALGAGEVVLNSIDTDGVKQGFDLEMLNAVTAIVDVPVIASGGAGGVQDFVTLFREAPGVDAGLAASIFHFGEVGIPALKQVLAENGINVRRIG